MKPLTLNIRVYLYKNKKNLQQCFIIMEICRENFSDKIFNYRNKTEKRTCVFIKIVFIGGKNFYTKLW